MNKLFANNLKWDVTLSGRDSITFSLEGSGILIIAGPVASGKTRLLKCFVGENPDACGSVLLNGVELLDHTPYEIARRRVAFVPQGRGLFRDLTAGENLRLAWELSRRFRWLSWTAALAGIDQDAPQVMPWLNRRAAALSGGQQRVMAIVMAWITDPLLLVLDEPLTGLDSYHREWLCRLIDMQQKRGGMAIIAVQDKSDITTTVDIYVQLKLGGLQKVELARTADF